MKGSKNTCRRGKEKQPFESCFNQSVTTELLVGGEGHLLIPHTTACWEELGLGNQGGVGWVLNLTRKTQIWSLLRGNGPLHSIRPVPSSQIYKLRMLAHIKAKDPSSCGMLRGLWLIASFLLWGPHSLSPRGKESLYKNVPVPNGCSLIGLPVQNQLWSDMSRELREAVPVRKFALLNYARHPIGKIKQWVNRVGPSPQLAQEKPTARKTYQ